jgi:probable DNA metabolism protein
MKHFKDRYADQSWVIYDYKRHYGIYYNLDKVEEICLNQEEEKNLKLQRDKITSEQEPLYAALWKDYFKSTNIKARKNTKLHVRHVPRRYWKYLTEKE